MTEEQQKEAISREFLRILAYGNGYKVLDIPVDHGVDMTICAVTKRVEPSGRTRYLDSQFRLDVQLKSTTPASIEDDVDAIRFDLEVKTYNDLVHRRIEPLPLHLVVVVLDASPPACVRMDQESLGLAGRAYWFLPDEDAVPSENGRQIRITIPKVNLLHVGFVRDRFLEFGVDL